MTKRMKFASVGIMIIAGVCAGHAQTNSVTTNVTLVANIALSGFKQAATSNAAIVKITSKDILTALNNTGQFNFGKNAQLIFLSSEDQLPTVWVRQGSGASETLTDISDFFTISQPGEVDGNHNLISYSIRIFTFDDHNGTSFSVRGLSTLRRSHITSRNIGPLLRVSNAQTQVAGDGIMDNAELVLHGSINGTAAKAELH